MIVIPKFYPGQKAAIRKGNGDAYLCIRGFAFGAFITIRCNTDRVYRERQLVLHE